MDGQTRQRLAKKIQQCRLKLGEQMQAVNEEGLALVEGDSARATLLIQKSVLLSNRLTKLGVLLDLCVELDDEPIERAIETLADDYAGGGHD